MTTPASAFIFLTIKATPGVVITPRSTTVAPLASKPVVNALCSISPLWRVSRPIRKVGCDAVRERTMPAA